MKMVMVFFVVVGVGAAFILGGTKMQIALANAPDVPNNAIASAVAVELAGWVIVIAELARQLRRLYAKRLKDLEAGVLEEMRVPA